MAVNLFETGVLKREEIGKGIDLFQKGQPVAVQYSRPDAVSQATELLKDFEGFRPNAYLPTKDDVPTIGYGRTANVKIGDVSDKESETQYLQGESEKISSFVDEVVEVPINQNQKSALMPKWAKDTDGSSTEM